jgi:uncharacterized membrane protein YbhN (UPF0104 family)
MLRRLVRLGGRAALLLVTGLSLYVLFPSLVSVFSSWRTLSTIDWFWAQLMVIAEALSFVAIWRLQRIALQERTRGAAEAVTRVARLRLCGALLGMIPLTPGGLGFVEAGLVGRSRSRASMAVQPSPRR